MGAAPKWEYQVTFQKNDAALPLSRKFQSTRSVAAFLERLAEQNVFVHRIDRRRVGPWIEMNA